MKIEGKDIADMSIEECVEKLQEQHKNDIDLSRQVGCFLSILGLLMGCLITWGIMSMFDNY